MIQLYAKAGTEAERIFILNMLPELVKELAGSVEKIKIDKIAVIDSGTAGTGVASAAAQFPEAIIPTIARRSLSLLVLLAACGPSRPCETSYWRRIHRSSRPYAGDWIVVRGDTLTLPEGMGDRFKLRSLRLDTLRAMTDGACPFRGILAFEVPRTETLAVTWFGEPERFYIFGWPADLGPFCWNRRIVLGHGLAARRRPVRRAHGRPDGTGVTAEFVAARRAP